MHFYDASFPTAPGAVLRPPDATVDDYRSARSRLGTARVVVVQPTTYGMDNGCQLAGMAALGDAARGVMVVDSDTPRQELERLTTLGVCGARFHMLPGGAVDWSELEPTAAAVADLGWHIQLQLDGNELPDHLERLLTLPTDLVVDHVGRFMPPHGTDSPGFHALRQLLATGRCWVKLSAPYEGSDLPRPHDDVVELIDALVAEAPERLLWASNWPHPGQADPPTLDDLTAWRDRWIPPRHRQRILVDNPTVLYDFPPSEATP
ncbi:MAG: amidohydrolase family protein [Actinomycetota bacterium]